MANPSKAKGTQAESAVVQLAQRLDIPAVRPSLSGANDQGDVWLWPIEDGAQVTVEVKNRPTEFAHFPSWPLVQDWWAQAEREAVNTPNCDLCILAVKPIGVGYSRSGDWWGWVLPDDMTEWVGQYRNQFPAFGPQVPMMFPLGSLLAWLSEVKQQ